MIIIILKKDIKNIGFKYDKIKVSPGYARNYLIPKGYAEIATKSSLKNLQELLKQKEIKEKEIIINAKKIEQKIKKLNIVIYVKSHITGKFFSSINSYTISKKLKEYNIDIDKKLIIINKIIKNIGKYKAIIRLHRNVKFNLFFKVEKEQQKINKIEKNKKINKIEKNNK
ncbi:50S ribosomal protein L9 [Candidatus Shikimatogenerans silvanidophilus]|uniref:50S ribosomal protein L9 n=1 Tax=Candidatus Shikimatogenerans silvanidophilus TaxID=2782547 RepID=UPI001BB3632F|nr:50S ribosomal protein L9 [Candidatus Shikimatogenerans silvanidophilus]